MSIHVSEQLCLQLHSFKCLGMHKNGNYCLRIHLYYKDPTNGKLIFSPPTSSKHRMGCIMQNSYRSRYVPIRHQQDSPLIDEVCLFRTSLDTSLFEDYRLLERILYCQLLSEDVFSSNQDRNSKCCEFTAELRGLRLNDYVEICFDDKYACTVTGSIHSIGYKYEFVSNEEELRRREVERRREQQRMHIKSDSGKGKEEVVIQTLQQYVARNGEERVQPLLQFFIETLMDDSKQLETLYRKYLQAVKLSQPSLLTQKQVQQYLCCLTEQRERKRIFQTPSTKKFQQRMHRQANRAYMIWSNFIKLVSLFPDPILYVLKQKSQQKWRQKWGESVVKMQCQSEDWTLEKYPDSGKEHLATAQKLRAPLVDLEFSQRMNFVQSEVAKNRKFKTILFDEVYVRKAKRTEKEERKKGRHLIVLVHGLGASRHDMEKLAIELRREYNVDTLCSSANEGRTEGDIAKMGQRLAKQVVCYIMQKQQAPHLLSFVGHSMGSVIIRSALPHLQQLKRVMYCFVSLSSPHVGYLYNPSTLIDAGLWLINTVQKCTSVQQLCLQDSQQIQNTFIYKLSKQKGIEWFSKIALFSSYQDSYVPYDCARIQKGREAISDKQRGLLKGIRYCEMVDNIVNRMSCQRLRRVDVSVEIQGKTVDNLIGRAAHIKFVSCPELIKLIVSTCGDVFT